MESLVIHSVTQDYYSMCYTVQYSIKDKYYTMKTDRVMFNEDRLKHILWSFHKHKEPKCKIRLSEIYSL